MFKKIAFVIVLATMILAACAPAAQAPAASAALGCSKVRAQLYLCRHGTLLSPAWR